MRALIPVLLLISSCGTSTPDDPALDPDAPMVVLPTDLADHEASLRAGAAVRSVTPDCWEMWTDLDDDAYWDGAVAEPFEDCGCDRLCPDDPGYPGPDDGEGDEVFQTAWIAGFGNKRAMTGVRGADQGLIGVADDLQARALVLEQGDTRVAIVAIDAIGWMYDDVVRMRTAVADAGLEIDHLIVHSSHSHSAPDTMGIYGPTITTTGYTSRYADQTYAAVVEAVSEAADGLVEVNVRMGQVDANDYADNGVANLISDTRDPVIVDPRVGVLQFVDASEATVATMVHWANHPESIASRNTLLSAGFVHPLREVVENGSTWPDDSGKPGVGGTTLFINGTVGGMMTSLRASVTDPTGAVWADGSWEKTDAVGMLVGEMALDALDAATPVDDPDLSVVAEQVTLPVDNIAFQAMFFVGVLDHREVVDFDDEATVDEVDNWPDVVTEVDVLDLGPVRMLTIPGELFPEGAIGGYDGSFTPPGVPIVDPGNPNPPKLDEAPAGPYLLERVGKEMTWVIGLGNDEIGYIIPTYNFEVPQGTAYFVEAEGDHYEETNSLGPTTFEALEAQVDALAAWLDARE